MLVSIGLGGATLGAFFGGDVVDPCFAAEEGGIAVPADGELADGAAAPATELAGCSAATGAGVGATSNTGSTGAVPNATGALCTGSVAPVIPVTGRSHSHEASADVIPSPSNSKMAARLEGRRVGVAMGPPPSAMPDVDRAACSAAGADQVGSTCGGAATGLMGSKAVVSCS